MKSHPSWVCGLKLLEGRDNIEDETSHPSWVCGLKLPSPSFFMLLSRHTLRGCVD